MKLVGRVMFSKFEAPSKQSIYSTKGPTDVTDCTPLTQQTTILRANIVVDKKAVNLSR